MKCPRKRKSNKITWLFITSILTWSFFIRLMDKICLILIIVFLLHGYIIKYKEAYSL